MSEWAWLSSRVTWPRLTDSQCYNALLQVLTVRYTAHRLIISYNMYMVELLAHPYLAIERGNGKSGRPSMSLLVRQPPLVLVLRVATVTIAAAVYSNWPIAWLLVVTATTQHVWVTDLMLTSCRMQRWWSISVKTYTVHSLWGAVKWTLTWGWYLLVQNICLWMMSLTGARTMSVISLSVNISLTQLLTDVKF